MEGSSRASRRAIASSWPGSQSSQTFLGEEEEEDMAERAMRWDRVKRVMVEG